MSTNPTLPLLGEIPDWPGELPHLTVAFDVRQIRSAEVVWLNARWFLSHGINVLDRGERITVETHLLEKFGVEVPRREIADFDIFYGQATFQLHADRYGASGGTPFGGAGRCGALGCLNAKGVGPTPLVAKGADIVHSSGCVGLEEAVSEAIASEVAAAEFPYGAVPVVAILHIADQDRARPENYSQRRAILVRPNFVRPAHFERSVLFGDSGHNNSDQYLDVLRVREVMDAFASDFRRRIQLGLHVAGPNDIMLRIASQVAFGWAHRMYHGTYISSNITADGQLVDFGCFRALPSWRRALTVSNMPPFGLEMAMVAKMSESMRFYFGKFAPDMGGSIPNDGGRSLRSWAEKEFHKHLGLLFCVDAGEGGAGISNILAEYYHAQQEEGVDYYRKEYRRRRPWLWKTMASVPSAVGRVVSEEEKVARRLYDVLTDLSGRGESSDATAATRWQAGRRHLRPRPWLFRENLTRLLFYAFQDRLISRPQFRLDLERLICWTVNRSRRVWRKLPGRFLVHGQVSNGYSHALYCTDVCNGKRVLYLEGASDGECAFVFGKRIELKQVSGQLPLDADGQDSCHLIVPMGDSDTPKGATIYIGHQILRIPPPDLTYT